MKSLNLFILTQTRLLIAVVAFCRLAIATVLKSCLKLSIIFIVIEFKLPTYMKWKHSLEMYLITLNDH